MSQETPNLRMPYIMPSQAQKHVTHNDAIRTLDALVQMSVLDEGIDIPPGAPGEGDRYIIGATPSRAWEGKAGLVAAFQDGSWAFFTPRAGWLTYVASRNSMMVYDGTHWQKMPTHLRADDFQNAAGLGINTSFDTINRVSVSAEATLLSHEGSGHQVKVNKKAESDTASVLFQTNWNGRAELGTTGEDHFCIKVSPDGSAWIQSVQIDHTNGSVGIGGVTPERPFHIRGAGSALRLDGDSSFAAIQMHGFSSEDMSTPWKGFVLGVEAHASDKGRFFVSDYGTKLSGSASHRLIIETSGEVTPGSDNMQPLGAPSCRWSQVYTAAAIISTSDEREKQEIGRIPDEWLDAWETVEWCRFKHRSAVQQKDNRARWHTGLVAQRVRDCFEAHGLNAFDLGLLCYDQWSESPMVQGIDEREVVSPPPRMAGSRFGIRYEEALAMEAAWQRRELRRLRALLVTNLKKE